jgi:hypothetical protein
MGAAMTHWLPRSCAKRFANASAARCQRPRSATVARAEPSAVLTVCQGLRRAARSSRWNRRNARTFGTRRCPGTRAILPPRQDLSLFFNTLKINRSGIMLAFD